MFIFIVVKSLILIVSVLISVAFLTLFERKLMASMQVRSGPSTVGILGLLQAFADGLKLLIKETILPVYSNRIIFLIAPILTFFLSFINWALVPYSRFIFVTDINIGILLIFAISSLSVYGIILSGWASNSKYAFLGSLRAAAQMISYEISIGLIIISVLFCSNSLNLNQIVLAQAGSVWFIIPFFPIFILFFISFLAETNRPPFDLPEAEAELVAGYFVEYSSMAFAFFFLAENANIIFSCVLVSIFFFGGWHLLFAIKVLFFLFSFIWIRVTFPRFRYDQLMRLGWKVFLPLSIGWVIFFSSIFISYV